MKSLVAVLLAFLTTCALSPQLYRSVRGEEGSSDGVQRSADVLLLHSGRETAAWFNASSADALLAARLASDDIAHRSAWQLTSLTLVENTSTRHYSLPLSSSVVAVASVECADETCHAQRPLHGLPVVSASPSCLRRNTNITSPPSNLLCMLPSLDHLPVGVAALIAHYGWQRIAVVSETESNFAAGVENISIELKKVDVGDIRLSNLSSHLLPFPSDILHRDYRIVVLNLAPPLSRQVLCEASNQNLHRHVWITPGWYPHLWWQRGAPVVSSQSQQLSCSDEDLEEFLLGRGRRRGRVVSVLQSPAYSLSDPRYADFQERCGECGIADCGYAGLAYDAVCAISRALTNASSPAANLSVVLSKSKFCGVSGQVEFDSAGYRVLGGYTVGQLRDNGSPKNVPIATITEGQSMDEGEGDSGGEVEKFVFAYVNNESDLSVWPDGVPPDGSPLTELRHPLLVLVFICYVLSGGVILLALVCIIFNIYFRKKKLIKLTSPMLNLMIAVGIILANLATPMSMYLPVFEGALSVFCIVRSFVLAVGWSLSLCTISVKMWRVYIIYRTTMKLQTLKRKRLRRFLHDQYMVGLVMCMVVVDLIVVTLGTSIPVTRFRSQTVPDKEFSSYRNDEDIEVIYYNNQCITEKGLIWVAFLFGYKVLFLISGMVLAFLTRKVKVRGLNESREVRLVMIITTPITLAGIILRLVLPDYLNVVGTTFALGTALCGAIILGIIFLPKMINLCKNPSGDLIYISTYHSTNRSCGNSLHDRSFANNSLKYTLEPSSSLGSLFRKPSVESGIIPIPEVDGATERDRRHVIRNILLSLPTIEEATCSNDATTEGSEGVAGEAKPFILKDSGCSISADCGEENAGTGRCLIEDSINSRKLLLKACTSDDTVDGMKDSGSNSSSDLVFSEGVAMPSPTQPIVLSQLTEDQKRLLRQSWLTCNQSSSHQDIDTANHLTTIDSGGLNQSHVDSPGLLQSTDDSSGLNRSHTNSPGLLQLTDDSGGLNRLHVDSPGPLQSTDDSSGLNRSHTDSPGLLQLTDDSGGLNRSHVDSPGLSQSIDDSSGLNQSHTDSSGHFQLSSQLESGPCHSDSTIGSSRVFQSAFDSSSVTHASREEASTCETVTVSTVTSCGYTVADGVEGEMGEQDNHDSAVETGTKPITEVLNHHHNNTIEVCS